MTCAIRKTQVMTRYGAIEDVMDRWARWAEYRISGELGYPRKTILGKLLDGMPGSKCPCCLGSKRIEVGKIGSVVQYATCPQCSGLGEVKTAGDANKVNPYFIRPTGGFTEREDPVSQRIDWLVCTFIEEKERSVVMAEYRQNGNRNMKIRKLRITHLSYNNILASAHDKLADGLMSK